MSDPADAARLRTLVYKHGRAALKAYLAGNADDFYEQMSILAMEPRATYLACVSWVLAAADIAGLPAGNSADDDSMYGVQVAARCEHGELAELVDNPDAAVADTGQRDQLWATRFMVAALNHDHDQALALYLARAGEGGRPLGTGIETLAAMCVSLVTHGQ